MQLHVELRQRQAQRELPGLLLHGLLVVVDSLGEVVRRHQRLPELHRQLCPPPAHLSLSPVAFRYCRRGLKSRRAPELSAFPAAISILCAFRYSCSQP
eukprot:3937820-Rhodomonas_salina.1